MAALIAARNGQKLGSSHEDIISALIKYPMSRTQAKGLIDVVESIKPRSARSGKMTKKSVLVNGPNGEVVKVKFLSRQRIRFDIEPGPVVIETTYPHGSKKFSIQTHYGVANNVKHSETCANKENYVLNSKCLDNKPVWAFGPQKKKLEKCVYLSLHCYGANNEKVFKIPYSYLREKILPSAHLEKSGSYKFEVNKRNFTFNWHHGIKMDGKQFLLKR